MQAGGLRGSPCFEMAIVERKDVGSCIMSLFGLGTCFSIRDVAREVCESCFETCCRHGKDEMDSILAN